VVSQYTYWNPKIDVRCIRDGKDDSYCHPKTYKRVHFGLGQENAIKSVEIRWPRGAVQVLENVPADRVLKIDEPQK